jgi:hypothetical protein
MVRYSYCIYCTVCTVIGTGPRTTENISIKLIQTSISGNEHEVESEPNTNMVGVLLSRSGSPAP